MDKKIPSKEEMLDYYNYFKKTVEEIAQMYGVDTFVVRKWLDYYGIPIRSEDKVDKIQKPIIYSTKNVTADYVKIQNKIYSLGIKFNNRHLNSILFHNRNETPIHFLAKCIVSKLLRDHGHNVYSEGDYKGKILDVIDLDTNTVYELETKQTNKKSKQKKQNIEKSVFNLLIIDLKDVPTTIDKMFQFFKEKIIV